MGRLVKMRDLLVHAIDRKRILNEIVCSNTEKIDLGCEHACADGCAWDLYHRANLESFGHIDFGAAQFLSAFIEHRDRPAQFIQPGDHRKHDFYVADGAGTENSAQLRLEDVYILKTETDRAPAKKRVQLIGDIYCTRSQFIAAEIKRSNNQRIRPDALRDFSINFVLFVLAWQSRSVQIQKLGAIKSDALGAIGLHGIDILWEFDICREHNVTAIARG